MLLPVISLLLAVVTSATAAVAQTQLSSVRIASGFVSPTHVTSPVGDEDRLFVCEQSSGLIKVIKRGAVLSTPFLNVRARILPGSEQGLLCLAFDPRYPINGYFYVSYTRAGDGASVIERYNVSSSNPDVAAPNSGVVCFGPITQPYANHNGGNIQFGPDGKLYFGLGDGGSADDPHCSAQNKQSLLGKMLRLEASTVPFSVPGDNPFVGNSAYRPEIWALGLRNPWRFSFDRLTGDMFLGDVGQSTQEELDFEPARTGGRNYGWKVMEGTTCFGTTACNNPPACNSAALTLPFHSYANSSNCSITGGYVYRGCSIPDLRGTYFFGDFCSGRIWSLRYSGSTVTELRDRTSELVPGVGRINEISSFGEDARGELQRRRLLRRRDLQGRRARRRTRRRPRPRQEGQQRRDSVLRTLWAAPARGLRRLHPAARPDEHSRRARAVAHQHADPDLGWHARADPAGDHAAGVHRCERAGLDPGAWGGRPLDRLRAMGDVRRGRELRLRHLQRAAHHDGVARAHHSASASA